MPSAPRAGPSTPDKTLPFVRTSGEIIAMKSLGHRELRLLQTLELVSGGSGIVKAGNDRIAKRAGMSTSSVVRSMSLLEEAGHVKREFRDPERCHRAEIHILTRTYGPAVQPEPGNPGSGSAAESKEPAKQKCVAKLSRSAEPAKQKCVAKLSRSAEPAKQKCVAVAKQICAHPISLSLESLQESSLEGGGGDDSTPQRQRPGPDADAPPPRAATEDARPPEGPMAGVLGRVMANAREARSLAGESVVAGSPDLTPEESARLAELPEKARAEILEWLGTGAPVVMAEARKRLRPPRPAGPAPAPAGATFAELVEAVATGDRSGVMRVANLLMVDLGDKPNSWRFLEGLLKEVFERRRPAASLIEPYERLKGRATRPKNPAAYFARSVKNWDREHAGDGGRP